MGPTAQGASGSRHRSGSTPPTYRTGGVSESEFIEANQEFAQMMAEVPGLVAKFWLRGPGEDGYGGVYLWQDRAAHDDFIASDLWAEVLSDESVQDLTTRDFEVMDDLTRMTLPGLSLVGAQSR